MPEIADWLRTLGIPEYAERFAANGIDLSVLRHLTDQDLKDIGVLLGHRRKMLAAIAELASTPPAALQPALAEARQQVVAERRQLTVAVVDLVGSTALAARLDPEDMREIIGAYHRCVADAVARLDGFIAKYMGDGVLVYFGYPQAHEDDAERAVRAGLALVDNIGRLKVPEPLRVRVGIGTGLVVVGDLITSGEGKERGIVGETPNLAARLQALAEPNAVVIGPQTQRLLGSLFEYRDLGAVELKGFPEPIHAHQVVREGALESRFEALHGVTLTPLVGREEEIDLLRRQWDRAKCGDGRVVLLSGEPGIGKSRLTAALQERIENEPHARLRYFCSPYHQDSALHPIIAQFERAAGFEREDTLEGKLDKLAVLAPASPEDGALLADLLSLPTDGRFPPPQFTPRRKKEKTFEALLRQLEALARQRPVLMLFEDVHWIDPSSCDLLDLIVERVPRLPVLLVVTFRPEFQPPWTGQSHVTVLVLNRLDIREGAALVQRVAGAEALPGEVVTEIVERTDGVPLFVEELTKAVLEGGNTGVVLSRAGATVLNVPATLHASLMARLDRLGSVAKEVAQVGAALGREFSYELLAAVAQRNATELNAALDQLVVAGLTFRRGVPPQATFLFKHALVQDAAYGTLLRGSRQQLHARIAKSLEDLFPETAATTPELLAHHWAEAGSTMRAMELWTAAGERALARAANREASGFFERALVTSGRLEPTADLLARVIDLHCHQYDARYKFGELQGARANLIEAERLAVGLNETTRLVRILAQQTYILASAGDLAGALRTGGRAVALADCAEDLEGHAGSHTMLARALYAKGWYREAIGHLRQAIEMMGEDVPREFSVGMNQALSARVWLLLCCAELGQFAEAAAQAKFAEQLLAPVEDGHQQEERVWLRLAVGRLAVLQGDFDKAIETLEPALLPCESEFVIYFSRVASSLGIAHARLGRAAKGVALLRQAVSRDQAIDFHFRFGLLLAQLGEVLLLANDI